MSESIGPAWQRVADDLKAKISSGELQVDTPIPSTTKLTKQYDVSVTVVRQAVAHLRSAGLLIGHSGKAVYVKAKPEDVAEEQVSVQALTKQLADLREEVRGIAERLDSTKASEALAAEVEELRSMVGKLQADLINLYSRTGQPNPENASTAKPDRRRHRNTGS